MASTTATILGRQLIARLTVSNIGSIRSIPTIGSFSTHAKSLNDPSNFVQGVTVADLEKDPVLAEYFEVNFPDYGKGEENTLNATQSIDTEDDDLDNDETTESSYPMNIRPLSCFKREEEGSQPCYRIRERELLIPGLLYGSDPTQNILSKDPSSKILVKTPWELIQREMDRYTYHNFESRVYDLTLFEDEDDMEGVVHRVVPANVQHHPWKKQIYCANYLRYFPGKPINIPIVYVNEEESGPMKRGGFIVPQNRHISCLVEEGVPIPEAVEMDCTGLRLKEVIRMDRIIFPEGVRASKKVNRERFLVGTLFGRRADDIDDAAGEEEDKDKKK